MSHDLWIFGYGSLMWRPGFAFAEQQRGRALRHRRCFCITSTYHRGSEARPGLVLGLDRGGACEGVAYRVAGDQAATTLAYLRERELVYGVYRETRIPVVIGDGHGGRLEITALAYVAERCHPSYVRGLSLDAQARVIRGAAGLSGVNLDYLVNTMRQLRALGIREPELERLMALAAPHLDDRHAGGDQTVLVRPGARALMGACRHVATALPRLKLDQRRRFIYRIRLDRTLSDSQGDRVNRS